MRAGWHRRDTGRSRLLTAHLRNVSLYPAYCAASDAFAWLPVFFLFFSEQLTLQQVLLLEAVYYIAAVAAEVPSGYLSDVIGRRVTLIVSSAMVSASYVFFLSAENFAGFAIAQCLLAVGAACRSGTDTSLLYESLSDAGQATAYGHHEARAGRIGFLSTALAALAGGLLGAVDLSWPYWLSLFASLVALGVAWRFSEPGNGPAAMQFGFVGQLMDAARYWKNGMLFWLTAYFVVMNAIVHVPYEFYQPYLDLLAAGNRLGGFSAPVTSGVVFALTAMVGAWVAGRSMDWRNRFGLLPLLIMAAGVELVVIAALAFVLHPVLALLVLLRNGPMAVITAPMRAAIAPHVANAHRATFLSLQSLAARLGFALFLAALSGVLSADGALSWSSLSLLLRVALLAGCLGVLVLWLTGRRIGVSGGRD